MSWVPNTQLPLRKGYSPIIKKTEVHRDFDIRMREGKKDVKDPVYMEEEKSSNLGCLKTIPSKKTKGRGACLGSSLS